MGIKLKGLGLVSVLSVASLAAAADLRLVQASEKGDKEAVRSLLKQHADVNASQADGATALAWAAYRDDLETAELLIGARANVNAANDYGVTPLSLACNNGSPTMVDKLLKAMANPNAASSIGETPLMRCARTGSVQAIKSLLARGGDVNAKENQQGLTALMWAAAARHPEVTLALIESGADVNARTKRGFTPLMFAAQQGDMGSARMLLTAGARVNEATNGEGDTALLVASMSGHEALSIFLLDKGANANAADENGFTALHFALMKGLVLINRIKLRTSTGTSLSRPNMPELVKALLAHGANPNARVKKADGGRKLALYNAIDYATGSGSPVGATPFLVAAMSYDASLMRILAAAGADPRLATEENVTPLMVAAGLARQRTTYALTEEDATRALESVKLAVELGADVNAASVLGMTALHGAAFNGSDEIIRFLVEKGANLNAKDKAEQTPLHKAAAIIPAGVVPISMVPAAYRKSSEALLLKLGATPVSASVAQSSNRGAATVNAK